MAVQAEIDNSTIPFIKCGFAAKIDGVIAQDAQRTTELKQFTVMSQIAATGLWTPFNSVAGTDGSAVPRGIYLGGDIDAADLVAGNISNAEILVGFYVTVDEDQVVFDDETLTKASVINTGTVEARTAEQALRDIGIYIEDSVNISEYEN